MEYNSINYLVTGKQTIPAQPNAMEGEMRVHYTLAGIKRESKKSVESC